MASRYMKRWSSSLIIREMQIRITVRDHLTPIRMARIKKTTSVGRDVEKGEPSCPVGGNANRYSHRGKQYGDSSKN